ncbi:type II secretion system major pseudopilin GspG [Granulosicoccus antarcticus]|uniref:Type II secretion system core protein G n=1 Tax=Granulosicoccus antarcticus IMCC3135 TaxID=1192854 RepID=A0A2Z2NZF1_9GAMM|nr:type II secretion system major pseudopilin GspG [Granulosicoccus antarcticus]ASJ76653.1 Type II secretion system protein G [Granulosicoccus antarcticus IMCC3135]
MGKQIHQGAVLTARCTKFTANTATVRRKRQSGFTLIEIMVVVAIIAILGATVVPLIMDRPNEARVVRAKNDIASFSSALELYKLDNFNYPSTEQGLEALVTKPTGDPEPANWNGRGYVKKLSKDPWGREYIYQNEEGDFEIISLGNDGVEGGEEFDADISNFDPS